MPEEVRRVEVDEIKGFQDITCHILFDVKIDFTCKAGYVANGSMTDMPVGLCYPSAVSCDSVRIELLVAVFNDIDILECDISNTYLNAPLRERIWFVAGLECEESIEGKVMKLVRALYELKISEASWRKIFKYHIVNCLIFTQALLTLICTIGETQRRKVLITMIFCWFMLTTY